MHATDRQHIFWAMIAIMAGWSLFLYHPFQYYFLNDDLIHIPLSSRGELFQRRSFRPLADLSVMMDFHLWGKRAWGYHFTNLLLHLGNTIAVYFFARAIFKNFSTLPPGKTTLQLLALLFWMYAMHSESVFWILGRSGSLGCLFFQLACILYFKRNQPFYYVGSLVIFVLGLLAYESVWIFPLVALIISFVPSPLQLSSIKKPWLYPLIVWLIFIAYLFTRHQAIGEIAGQYEASSFKSGAVGILLANTIKLLGRTFLPPLYTGMVIAMGIFYLVVGGKWLLISGLRVVKGISRLLLILLVLLVLSVLPYASLGIDTHGVEGERFLYLPSVFAVMLLAVFINADQSAAWKRTIWVLLFALHTLLLTRSATLYKTASAIVQTTFIQINALNNKQRLFIDSLPQSYNGALIFRLGFNEGAKWLTSKHSVDSIFLLSQKTDNSRWLGSFGILLAGSKPQKPVTRILVPDTTQVHTYVLKNTVTTYFNKATDVWFTYKSNGIEVAGVKRK